MKCVIICLMALYAFEAVFGDSSYDFLKLVQNISFIVEKDINDSVAFANKRKIMIGNCKDIAMVALQNALYERQHQEASCTEGKQSKELLACSQKAYFDLKNDVKPIGPALLSCIRKCVKTKNCNDN